MGDEQRRRHSAFAIKGAIEDAKRRGDFRAAEMLAAASEEADSALDRFPAERERGLPQSPQRTPLSRDRSRSFASLGSASVFSDDDAEPEVRPPPIVVLKQGELVEGLVSSLVSAALQRSQREGSLSPSKSPLQRQPSNNPMYARLNALETTLIAGGLDRDATRRISPKEIVMLARRISGSALDDADDQEQSANGESKLPEPKVIASDVVHSPLAKFMARAAGTDLWSQSLDPVPQPNFSGYGGGGL